MKRKLKMGMVGGGRGAFIGGVHRRAANLDGEIELVAGAFSSDPKKSKLSGKDFHLDSKRVYGSYQEMAEAEAALETFKSELAVHNKSLAGWQKMVDVFDHAGIIDGAIESIATMETTVSEMSKLWSIRKDVDKVVADSKLLLWEGTVFCVFLYAFVKLCQP